MNRQDAKKAAGVMRQIIDTHLAEIIRDNPEVVSSMKIKTIRFDEDGFKTTLEVQWVDGLTPEQRMYDIMRDLYELPARGETFVQQGHAFWIDGMKTKGQEMWVTAHDSKNAKWLFRPQGVKELLERNPQVASFTITDKKIIG